MSNGGVTHRLIRHAVRDITATTLHEGAAPIEQHYREWEAVCACNRVFRSNDENACSAAYLGHLPNPNKGRKRGRKSATAR